MKVTAWRRFNKTEDEGEGERGKARSCKTVLLIDVYRGSRAKFPRIVNNASVRLKNEHKRRTE